MDTTFSPIDDVPDAAIPVWSLYFHAADAWLTSLQTLMDNYLEAGAAVFYVEPTMVALCIEMYAKSLARHFDNTFQAKSFSHDSQRIITTYQNDLPVFARIANDALLMELIGEYQKTINVKYGEMYVKAPKSEKQLLIDVIFELRDEICQRTGLH